MLLLFESPVAALTLAVLVIVPAAVVVITIVIVTLDPLEISPRLQVTVPPDSLQLPAEGVAVLKVTPAGNVSVSTTLAAVFGPLS